MSFVGNFSAAQVSGYPSQIVITDDSTGTDAAIVSRRIYLAKADGSYLVPSGTLTDYIIWPIGTTTKTIDALNKDYALLITVNWLGVSGTNLYTKPLLYGFTLYNEAFDYYLTQMLTANKLLINDNNFWSNKSDLRTYIDSGNQAISLASDQSGAQVCYDEATKLRLGSQNYFNSNA